MPGLIACNRRWDIGSDDLMFPAFIEICARLLWLIGIAVVFNTHKLSFDCSHGLVIQVYYIGILVILSCHIVMNVAIMAVSMQGTIIDQRPRRHMSKLLYIKLCLFLPELLWTILGTYWAFDKSSNCQSFVGVAMKVAAVVGWVVFLTLVIAILIVFDPLGSLKRSTEDNSSAAIKLWETRFRLIFCCAACDDQHSAAFSDTAKLFAHLFKDVDVVPTDIAVGLLLVHQQQKLAPQKYTYGHLTHDPLQPPQHEDTGNHRDEVVPKLVQVDRPDCDTLVQLCDNQEHGESISDTQPRSNGLAPSAYNNPDVSSEDPQTSNTNQSNRQTKVKTATGADVPSASSSDATITITGGDWHYHHDNMTVSIKDWMSVENAAHYMEFALGTYTWPVYMYMDLFCGACKLCQRCQCCCASQSSVNTVIGDNCCSCHLAALQKITKVRKDDILYANFSNKIYEVPFYVALDHKMGAVVIAIRGTMSLKDCLTDMSLECAQCYIEGLGEQFVHKGILQTAKYIQNTLDNLNLLTAAFLRAPNYNLVVTGHSLGAGVASLLAILLRPKYRFVQCFAFSPPGWLLSLPLAQYTEDFVCSVVIGQDLVPRLGVRTMEKLKVEILKVVRDVNRPKYRVLAGGCWQVVCGQRHRDDENMRSRLVSPVNTQRSYTEEEHRYQESVDDTIRECERSSSSSTNLYMPGVVLYFQEEEPTSGCFETPSYRANWAKQSQFDEILVSPKMLLDHLPDSVLKALQQSRETGVQARCVLVPAQHHQY